MNSIKKSLARPFVLILSILAGPLNAEPIDIGITSNSNNYNFANGGGGGGGGRGPVSPAIAPGLPGAPSQHGENSFRVEADRPCIIRKSDGTTQIVVLRHIVSATKASTTNSRGGSFGVSLISLGVSGSINNSASTPNPPKEEFERYLALTEAGQVVSCEAASDPNLRKEEFNYAYRTLQILRRGNMTGFAASKTAQAAYNDARIKAGINHPNLAQAEKLAAQGDYEGAAKLLQSQ
jgi:hypothetical protein